MERQQTTPGYERFLGCDITMTESFPGYPPQTSRGPISSILKDSETLTVKVHWSAVRTEGTDWTLFRRPRRKSGEVEFYMAQTKYLGEHDHLSEDGTYELSATYAGTAEILPEGDNLDLESVKKPPVLRR